MHDLRIASSRIDAVINNVTGAYTGTKADTYNVVVSGTTQQVGTLIVNENLSMTK